MEWGGLIMIWIKNGVGGGLIMNWIKNQVGWIDYELNKNEVKRIDYELNWKWSEEDWLWIEIKMEWGEGWLWIE